MERQQFSAFGANLAKGVIVDYLVDNLPDFAYDFFTKSDAQLLGTTIFPLYVDYFKPIRKTQMARRWKRRRVSKRKYGRKSKRYGRRRFGRRRGRMGKLGRRLRSKGIFAAEIKYLDAEITGGRALKFSSTRDPLVTFTNISEGVDYQSRIGAKVFIRKVRLGMQIGASEDDNAPNEQYVKWVVVRDKTPDLPAVPANLGEVLSGWYPNPGTTDQGWLDMFPMRHINNRLANRFQWLWSGMTKVIKDPGAGQQNVLIKKTINVFQPCYYGAEDALNDRGGGQIYMFFWSNNTNVASDEHPYINMVSRISYTDV